MIVRIDAAGQVTLDSPLDFKKFHVECAGGRDRFDACRKALAAVGVLETPDAAWIYARALRDWAPHAADPAYRQGLDGMLAYARTKNWMRDDIDAVRAHVVWTE
ncbi:MAG: hypothetical protein KIT16_00690 [Rhodospirillaceae bacterium]|nr:hypothetical protein [Rhodospirillaceae bacterium]